MCTRNIETRQVFYFLSSLFMLLKSLCSVYYLISLTHILTASLMSLIHIYFKKSIFHPCFLFIKFIQQILQTIEITERNSYVKSTQRKEKTKSINTGINSLIDHWLTRGGGGYSCSSSCSSTGSCSRCGSSCLWLKQGKKGLEKINNLLWTECWSCCCCSLDGGTLKENQMLSNIQQRSFRDFYDSWHSVGWMLNSSG